MLINRGSHQSGERGQVLVGAIAFLAFFALVAGSSLAYMSSIELQHRQGEISTSQRSLVEGAANYAVADLTRPGLPPCTTGTLPPGSATLSSGEVLTYTVNDCYPNGEPGTSASGPGSGCYLCVLSGTSNQTAFFDNQGDVTLVAPSGTDLGSVVASINDNVVFGGNPGTLCAQPYPSLSCSLDVGVVGTVMVKGNASSTLGTDAGPPVRPGSVKQTASPIPDPLLSTFSPPSLSGQDLGDQKTAGTIGPSNCNNVVIYDNIIISSGTLTLKCGIYVITQSLQVSGNGQVQGTGVTLFIGCNSQTKSSTIPVTCPTPSTPALATSSKVIQAPCTAKNPTNGYIATSGGGALSITAPTSGAYKNLALYADPNNPASMCTLGTAQPTIKGSIYGQSFGLDIEGNGVQGQIGNVVVGAIYVSVSSPTNGLNLAGSGWLVTGPTCVVYDATVSARASATGPVFTGRVIFQTAGLPTSVCSGVAGIINLSYSS
jgi:hypothetical protein